MTYSLDDPRAFSTKEYWRQAKRNRRNSPQYRKWREHILQKYNHACVSCGSKENLHVHHINRYNENFWLRLKNTNGVVLCKACHEKEHPWMSKEHPQAVTIRRRGEEEVRLS